MDGSDIKDMISYVLVCADGTCLCQIVEGNVFPISFAPTDSSWVLQTQHHIQNITGIEVTNLKLFKCYKIRISKVEYVYTYILSMVFQGFVRIDQKDNTRLKPGFSWLTIDELAYLYQNNCVTSDIFVEMFPKLADGDFSYDKYVGEFSVFDNIVELSSAGFHFRNCANQEINLNGSFLKQINTLFYKDFFALCSPSVLMTLYQFTQIMVKFGIKPALIPLLFKACDAHSNLLISFCEFVYLLCAMDPTIEHVGKAAEIRKRYLFKMYSKANIGLLNLKEVEKLINYVRLPNDPDTKTCIDMLKMSSANKKLTMNEFVREVDDLHLKGLSLVLRTNKPFLNCYSNSNDVVEDSKRNEEFARLLNENTKNAGQRGHELALHTLTVIKNGNLINIEDIWNLKDVCSHNTLYLGNITHDARRLSCEINSPTILYNQLIRDLRLLTFSNRRKSITTNSFNWGNIKSNAFGSRLIQVAATLKKLVASESRLVLVKSPVLVIGSLMGNYGILCNHERLFWPRCPGYCPGTILFLGNYTNKMQYGMEIITYLFCYKHLYPQKIYLLRGYYENRHIPEKAFYEECIKKFGGKLGNQVWEAVQEVFDCLPFAASVDGRIFCTAGGIPHPNTSSLAEAINTIPVPISNPKVDNNLAWEVLCNEPLKSNASSDNKATADGFKKNNKMQAYYFTDDAVCKYLDTNCYSHFITIDESISNSLELRANCRMISFKTNTKNDPSSETTCLLLDEGCIKPIQFAI